MVWTIETVGAVCIMVGLFTRFFAVAAGIQFAVITFIAHWPQGFWWNRPGGGWEYPLLWGLMLRQSRCAAGAPIRSTAGSGGSCSADQSSQTSLRQAL